MNIGSVEGLKDVKQDRVTLQQMGKKTFDRCQSTSWEMCIFNTKTSSAGMKMKIMIVGYLLWRPGTSKWFRVVIKHFNVGPFQLQEPYCAPIHSKPPSKLLYFPPRRGQLFAAFSAKRTGPPLSLGSCGWRFTPMVPNQCGDCWENQCPVQMCLGY